MSPMIATAPGKVILLGEYAVLDGSPALSLAVNRRARVELECCGNDECCIEAEQLGIEPIHFRLHEKGRVEWSCSGEQWQRFSRTGILLEHLCAHAAQRFNRLAPFRLRIDTAELFGDTSVGPVKLGLGSSAAVAVALDAAISAHASNARALESPQAVFHRILPVYRATQHGHGSGIDLATSLTGGLIEYRLDEAGCHIASRRLPESLRLMFIWVGEPASTADLVGAWRQAQSREPAVAAHISERMQETCQAGLKAVSENDAGELAAQMGVYGRILGTMTDWAGIPVVTAMHRQAMTLAGQAGAHYKPCGAGGGDLGVAAAVAESAMTRLADALTDTGLWPIALAGDEQGVRVTRQS